MDRRGNSRTGWNARAKPVRRQPSAIRPLDQGLGLRTELGGPVGEANIYALHPRGAVLLLPLTAAGLYHQVGTALAAGNEAVVQEAPGLKRALEGLPPRVASRLRWVTDWHHAARSPAP